MSAYLAFADPLARPWRFAALESLFFAAAVLTLVHVVRASRAGDRFALFQWLAVLWYGVWMELIAFNFLHNYVHAQFTVQLYHGQLPLYVVVLYPVFLYTGCKCVEPWRLSAVAEALLVGFVIMLLDVPFDVGGVDAGWWHWLSSDPTLAVRWLGVPVTSYYWYLIFGAGFALLGRALRRPLAARSRLVHLLCAPFFGAAIIVVGALGFLPFHALTGIGVRPDRIVLLHIVGCALLALYTLIRRRRDGTTTWPLPLIPLAIGALCVVVELALIGVKVQLGVVLLAWAASLVLMFLPKGSPL